MPIQGDEGGRVEAGYQRGKRRDGYHPHKLRLAVEQGERPGKSERYEP